MHSYTMGVISDISSSLAPLPSIDISRSGVSDRISDNGLLPAEYDILDGALPWIFGLAPVDLTLPISRIAGSPDCIFRD